MPSSLNIAALKLQPPYLLRHRNLGFNISAFSTHFRFREITYFSLTHKHSPPFYFAANAQGLSDSPDNDEGLEEKNESTKQSLNSREMLKKLKRYGISGILSYGLLNTAYYLTTFLVVWFYVTPAPGKMGYLAAVERFLKIMAMVWAGSQVTKLIRAAGALALAPFVDRGLSWFATKFNHQSREKAFAAIVGLCFGLAIILFFVITLLWA